MDRFDVLLLLAHAHAPADDRRRLSGRIHMRRFAYHAGIESGDAPCVLRRVLLDGLRPLIETVRMLAHELLVDESVIQDDVRERVEERDVRPVVERKIDIRDTGRLYEPRISDDDLAAVLLGFHYMACDDRVRRCGVIPAEEDAPGIIHTCDATTH